MPGFGESIQNELQNKEFRQSYVAENLRRGLAYQIRAIREARGWSQADLGRETEKPQSNVSRWEDPTYGKFSLQTLLEIAAALDVALIVRFAPFTELMAAVADLSPHRLAVFSYDEEVEAAQRENLGGAEKAILEAQAFSFSADDTDRQHAGAGYGFRQSKERSLPSIESVAPPPERQPALAGVFPWN
jgi:transcriptional regulator with XRE-family HTH domain